MSRKIIGVTVGTTLPKPDFAQTDVSKGDYIKNKPDFEGLENTVSDIQKLVGDTPIIQQISQYIEESGHRIYRQNEEPVDAPDGSLWIDMDEDGSGTGGGTGVTTSQIASNTDVLEFAMSMGYVNPVIANSNKVFTDNNNNVYVL